MVFMRILESLIMPPCFFHYPQMFEIMLWTWRQRTSGSEHHSVTAPTLVAVLVLMEITLGVLKSKHSTTFPRLQPNREVAVICSVSGVISFICSGLPLKYAAPLCFQDIIWRYDLDWLNPASIQLEHHTNNRACVKKTITLRLMRGSLRTRLFSLLYNYIKAHWLS